MKKEHYDHVTTHFNLEQFSILNAPNQWLEGREGKMNTSSASVRQIVDHNLQPLNNYRIHAVGESVNLTCMFVDIPSKELAEEICLYIKTSEILFI